MLTHGQSARAPSGMLRSAPLLGGPRGLQLQPQADSVAPQITWDSPKAHPWGNPALHPPLRGPQICPSFVLRAQQPLRARPGVLGSSSFEENPVAPHGKIPSLRPPPGTSVPTACPGIEESFILRHHVCAVPGQPGAGCRVCAQHQPVCASVSPAVKQQGGPGGVFRHCGDVGDTQITPRAL